MAFTKGSQVVEPLSYEQSAIRYSGSLSFFKKLGIPRGTLGPSSPSAPFRSLCPRAP